MYLIFLFDIMNNQVDYTECLQVVDYIQGKGKKSLDNPDFLTHVKYATSEIKVSWKKITDYKAIHCIDDMPVVEENDTLQYVFQVNCSEQDDIVNLIYYCLINDELNSEELSNSESILCIKIINSQKLIANVKDLLSNLIMKRRIKECYFNVDGEYRKISLGKDRKTKRFSPIFCIDEEEESVAYWRQSVGNFLLNLYRKSEILKGKNYTYQDNYFLPHVFQKKLKKQEEDIDTIKKGEDGGLKLIIIFSECFCNSDHKENNKVSIIERRYDVWKSREFFELVRDIPLLAMYIFCISVYFADYDRSEEQEKDILENARSEIFNARDMTDGLLQILENIYHSEKRRGYFCLRIHSNSEGRSEKYLREHYKQYINMYASENDKKDYLEVKIVDYSHCTIPNKFYTNFVKRMKEADEKDRRTYEEIQEDAQKIRIASFFETNTFLQKYNSISENVVHHYGLQIFDSFVHCYDGYFRVRSQEGYKRCGIDDLYCSVPNYNEDEFEDIGIPGTQYEIIIPFKKQTAMHNIALNVNIRYTDYLSTEYKAVETIDFTSATCLEVYEEMKKRFPQIFFQERKEKTIYELENRLSLDLENKVVDNTIIHFSAQKIALTMIELFCKAVMLYIANRAEGKACYIMITECKEAHFIEITRMLALFYDKQGKNLLMKNTQILLSGEKEGEEFLITGKNLGEVVGSTEKLAFSRCVNPDCLKILKNMLKNRNMGKNSNEIVSIVPFDMIKYDINRPTLFERDLKQVLNTEVQSEKFGCKLEGLHVRIGSKIHIRTFYEAELLFHNNYYTSRFAYWMRGEIINNPKIIHGNKITLVGYENYSEMLLSELRDMLRLDGMEVEYIIYEQKSMEKFRTGRPLTEYMDSQFVIIVPINSTVTTHIKVAGFLQKTIREELKKKQDSRCESYKLPQAAYYGIVLISSIKENDYWLRTDKRNVVVSKIDNEELIYYVEVYAEWSHPLKCKDCFPQENYTEELPLVETNKESIIPMQAIGIKKRSSCGEVKPDGARIEELSKLLIFDHIERNGNHFNYYFCTERLWDIPNIAENVKEWLRQKSYLFSWNDCKVYDIIVAPLHFSNTIFVEAVNRSLFKNAALVLHFDVDKEFRMNVKTKYSSLQQLYDNLCQDDEKTVINFHYVDDTIVSGRTYHRTKSLISSLITRKEGSKTVINVFKSVVLLLNRLSKASIKEYLDDPMYFLTYFDLNISSMRVNADACVLCKKHNEWNMLAEQASLNEVYLYWKKKSAGIECKSIEKIRKEKYIVDPKKQHRAELSMIASHRAKNLLDELCNWCNGEQIENEIVDKLFPEPNEESIDELIAVLKILGRPFLTFRREIKETSFKLMLTMLDGLLQEKQLDGTTKLERTLAFLRNRPDDRPLMIELLINRLAELESNYIIRKTSMEHILQYAEVLPKNEHFTYNYLNRVKQLVVQSNDFAKGLYLEFLLLYGEEYADGFEKSDMVSLEKDTFINTFKRKAYLENTKLFSYGIEALAACMEGRSINEEQLKKTLNDTYYLDNFVEYMAFHKMINMDEKRKIIDFKSEESVQKLIGMVNFQILYQKMNGKEERHENDNEMMSVEESLRDKYQQMLDALRMASGALDAEIIVPYRPNNSTFQKYIALEFGNKAVIRSLVNDERKLNEFIKNNSLFEGDTFSISEADKHKWVLIKVYDTTGTGDNIPVIYIVFAFSMVEDKELLHSIKNILVFRNKIQRMLNLSSSTLLENWTANLFYKQQMLKSRAVGHSELGTLSENIQKLSTQICSDGISIYTRQYYELLVNSMIGFMNSRVLGGKGKEYLAPSNYTLGEFSSGDKEVFDAACKVWNLNKKVLEKESLEAKRIRVGRNGMTPEVTVLRILFLAVFQNVKKHGLQKNGNIDILLYEESGCLCISNEIAESEVKGIEKEIDEEAYRSGEGISQAVISDICDSWYEDISFHKIFAVVEDNDKRNYVVKLPILERKEEK